MQLLVNPLYFKPHKKEINYFCILYFSELYFIFFSRRLVYFRLPEGGISLSGKPLHCICNPDDSTGLVCASLSGCDWFPDDRDGNAIATGMIVGYGSRQKSAGWLICLKKRCKIMSRKGFFRRQINRNTREEQEKSNKQSRGNGWNYYACFHYSRNHNPECDCCSRWHEEHELLWPQYTGSEDDSLSKLWKPGDGEGWPVGVRLVRRLWPSALIVHSLILG